MKDKAKTKLEDINDKIECALEIKESNLGYELTKAKQGYEGNMASLTLARDQLQTCQEEEDAVLQLIDSQDKTKEELLQQAQENYDTALRVAKTKYNKDVIAIEEKCKKTITRASSKCSDKMKLLIERVKRYESAVEVSKQNIERLENNKPKAITTAEYQAKKAQRVMSFVAKVESMNEFQKSTRDVRSNIAVERQADNQAPPITQVINTPPKPFVNTRPMPEDTPEQRAYWSAMSGVDVDELDNLRKDNLGAGGSNVTRDYLDGVALGTCMTSKEKKKGIKKS